MKEYINKAKKNIVFAGGDLRQIYAAEILSRNPEFSVSTIGFLEENIPSPEVKCFSANFNDINYIDILVLPHSISEKENILSSPYGNEYIPIKILFEKVKQGGLVCCGKLPSLINYTDKSKKIEFCNYFEREDFQIKNAVPTAEGAIQVAMKETFRTIWKSKVLVIGFGRIGKILSKRLRDMGADVTVSARSFSDRAYVESVGYKSISTNVLEDYIEEFDIIFNTVPALLITQSVLDLVSDNSLIIDLASKPGGMDFDYAKNHGKRFVWALSLPSRRIHLHKL